MLKGLIRESLEKLENRMIVENGTPISDGLKYHVTNLIPLSENVFRFESKNYFNLINEVRELYSEGKITLSSFDEELIKTNIGKKGIYEGKEVWLDVPLVNEAEEQAEFGDLLKDKMSGGAVIEKEELFKEEVFHHLVGGRIGNIKGSAEKIKRKDIYNLIISLHYLMQENKAIKEGEKIVNDLYSYVDSFNEEERYGKILKRDITVIKDTYDNIDKIAEEIKNDLTENNFTINEAEYKGREVKIGKPMRNSGGGKKYMVYVKDPKSGNVRKISFGDLKGGLTAKVSNPEARKRFAARHNCKDKKDRMTAGYWACRINRFGHLWGGKTYPGYW